MPKKVMNQSNQTTFFSAIGAHFGWVNEWWVPFAIEWARWEDTNASNNPLATTQPYPHSEEFNSAGVKNYATMDDGIQATIMTIDAGNYGGHDYYPTLRQVVQRQSISELLAQLVSEIQTWGTYGFAQALRDGFTPGAPILPPPVSDAPTFTIQEVYDYVNALNTVVVDLLAKLDSEAALTESYKPTP